MQPSPPPSTATVPSPPLLRPISKHHHHSSAAPPRRPRRYLRLVTPNMSSQTLRASTHSFKLPPLSSTSAPPLRSNALTPFPLSSATPVVHCPSSAPVGVPPPYSTPLSYSSPSPSLSRATHSHPLSHSAPQQASYAQLHYAPAVSAPYPQTHLPVRSSTALPPPLRPPQPPQPPPPPPPPPPPTQVSLPSTSHVYGAPHVSSVVSSGLPPAVPSTVPCVVPSAAAPTSYRAPARSAFHAPPAYAQPKADNTPYWPPAASTGAHVKATYTYGAQHTSGGVQSAGIPCSSITTRVAQSDAPYVSHEARAQTPAVSTAQAMEAIHTVEHGSHKSERLPPQWKSSNERVQISNLTSSDDSTSCEVLYDAGRGATEFGASAARGTRQRQTTSSAEERALYDVRRVQLTRDKEIQKIQSAAASKIKVKMNLRGRTKIEQWLRSDEVVEKATAMVARLFRLDGMVLSRSAAERKAALERMKNEELRVLEALMSRLANKNGYTSWVLLTERLSV